MGLFGKKDKEQRPPVAQTRAAPKAAPRSTRKDAAQDTTYFGKNLKVTGNVSGEGSLIILGAFEGEFNLRGRLKVAQGARVKGNVKATEVYVNGNVEGAIVASEIVHLDNTARIKGGIASPKISVLEGALFDGEIRMTGKTAPASKPAAAGSAQSPPASATFKKKDTGQAV